MPLVPECVFAANAHEGRRGRNAFAAAWNAIEGRAAPNDQRPHGREAAVVAAAAGQDAQATGHRHRYCLNPKPSIPLYLLSETPP